MLRSVSPKSQAGLFPGKRFGNLDGRGANLGFNHRALCCASGPPWDGETLTICCWDDEEWEGSLLGCI